MKPVYINTSGSICEAINLYIETENTICPQIDQPVKVRIQLRRPSDGAVSESRNFEFLPLDSGRNFWTTKRLKTNYNIFNR